MCLIGILSIHYCGCRVSSGIGVEEKRMKQKFVDMSFLCSSNAVQQTNKESLMDYPHILGSVNGGF